MTTIYKTPTDHIYQTMKKDALNVNREFHPIHQGVIKNCGTLNLVATVEEDKQTISDLKNFSSVVAFICHLKLDGELIGVGRSVSVISATKFFEKSIIYCRNAAILDSVSKSLKILDSLQPNINSQQNSGITLNKEFQVKEVESSDDSITLKQLDYLRKLIKTNVAENKRSELEKQLPNYSRDEASEKIRSFVINN